MRFLTVEETKKRIDNIKEAEEGNRKYLRRHRIGEYLSGQAVYNLGDYPKRFSIEPTEYDYNLLKSMKENGVELIQLHEEWNDAIRHLGADKFSSHDHQGLINFVKLAHDLGFKVLAYASTGFFDSRDPDYKEEYSICDGGYFGEHLHYKKCNAAHPEWKEYLLRKLFNAIDTYGFDGMFNDWGYDGADLERARLKEKGIDGHKLKALDMPYDPYLEDLLSTIYVELKKRGGYVKIHCDKNNKPPVKDKVYDYIWIGECVNSDDVGAGKEHEPYVVPCEHAMYADVNHPDAYYVKTIPFMQFPLLKRGRPLMGTGIDEEGVTYIPAGDYVHHKKVKEYMKDHPEGPYTYSLWSSVPDDVDEYPRWCRFMKLYKPMVEDNSIAYIELSECDDILSPITDKMCASMFVNENKYLVVSNFGTEPYVLDLKDQWENRETGERNKKFTINPMSIIFLKR